MNTKWMNLVLVGLMSVSTVSVSNVHAAGTTAAIDHLGRKATWTASDDDNGQTLPSKAGDGLFGNGNRWGTQQYTNLNQQQWLQASFESAENVQNFKITFEPREGVENNTTIKKYHIEAKNSGETNFETIYNSTDIVKQVETIKLESPVNVTDVKLVVDEIKSSNWNNVNVEEFEIYGDDTIESTKNVNHMRNATITVSSEENDTLTKKHLNDGIQTEGISDSDLNASRLKRWASNNENTEAVIDVVFSKTTLVKDVYLNFWRDIDPLDSNVQSFDIIYTDENDVEQKAITVSNTKVPNKNGFEDKVIYSFKTPVKMKKLKLTNFVVKEHPQYNNISIEEVEVYSNTRPSKVTLDNVVQTIKGQTLENVNELALPIVPKGFEVKFNGCDLEQIIDKDRQIHKPLVDKVVNVNWDVIEKSTGKKKNTGDLKYTVKGEYTTSEQGKNTSPVVIPEIQEWYSNSTDKLDINKLQTINYSDDSLKAIAEEFANDFFAFSGKKIYVSKLGTKTPGSIFIHKDNSVNYLGEEGYTMNITADSIEIKSNYVAGNMYGLQTILQMYKDNSKHFSVGEIRDYPRFSVRGLLLDVARKPISLEMMKEITRTMRYYKMNDFQAHLSDNFIFLEEYGKGDKEKEAFKAYEAFRLESGLKNKDGVSPTAKDYSISKKTFKKFIHDERVLGMNIVPEIDVPAHATSFTKVWPELAVHNNVSSLNSNRPLLDHFDLTKKEARDKIKEIFDDYTQGKNPTFDKDTTIHIGADEFLYNYKSYRQWLNEIVPYIKNTNTVRMWGGLTWITDNPLTPIDSAAIENVEMNLWSADWASGIDMYNMGYKLINTIDDFGYMVPSGNYKRANAYGDLLNVDRVFTDFDVNRIRNKGGAYQYVPSGDDQVLGAAFAIWSDNIDKKSNGLTESDLYWRFFDAMPYYAEKTWAATGKEKGSSQNLAKIAQSKGTGPNTNPYYQAHKTGEEYEKYDFSSMNDLSQNKRHLKNLKNATLNDGVLNLKGGNSFVNTPIEQLGNGHSLSFDIQIDKPYKPGQILFEETAPYGTHDIRIMDDGRLGFTRELHDYYFDYKLPVGKKVHIEITNEQQKTNLYVNGELTSSATGRFFHNNMVKKVNITNATFALPLERIGSNKNAIVASIDNVVVTDKTDKQYDQGKSKWTALAESETDYNNAKEGLSRYAFDGKAGTIWHSNWKGNVDKVPTSDGKPGVGQGEDGAIETTIKFNDTKKVNQISFTNRTDSDSGIVTQASLYVKPANATKDADNEGWVLVADKQKFAVGVSKKTFTFTSQDIVGFKFVAHQSNDGWVAVSEFDINHLQRDATLYVQSDATQGSVSFDRPTYNYGDIATVTAKAKKGYVFVGWYDAILGTQLSNKAEYTFKMQQNIALEARFRLADSPQVNKGELNALITDANTIDEKLCTSESYIVLKEALSEAKRVMSNADATQEEVDVVVKKLKNALENLVEITPEKPVEVTKDKLQALLDSALKLEEEDYTKETYKVLVDALEKAKAVLVDKDATQDAVNEAYDMLNKAIKGLAKVDVVKPQPQKPTQPESQQQTPSTNDSSRIVEFVVLGSVALVGLYIFSIRKKEHI